MPKSADEEQQLAAPDANHADYGATPTVPSEPGEGMTKSAFYITLFCAVANVFLGSMDSTMVATLLGNIASDLDAMDNVSWVATSYLLSCATFQPLFGKISDVFGRKLVVFSCVVTFAIGCAICGLATSLWWLVLGRFVAGIGGGGMMSLATVVVSDIVPNRYRGLYQGYVNLFFHSGAAGGGVIAGFVQKYFGWRNAFLLQVPLCLISGYLTYNYLNLPPGNKGLGIQGESGRKKLASLDYTGSFILVVSLLGLMIACALGGKQISFTSVEFKALIVFSVIGLTLFYFYEKKVAVEPVIPVNLLHNRTILASSFDCWFGSMNMFITLFYLPFFWNSVKNVSPLDCAWRLILGSIVASVSSIYAGYLIKKTSKYWNQLILSGVTMIIGSGIIYMSSRSDPAWVDALNNLVGRWACSANITIILVAMISAVSHSEQALVTSIQYGFRSTGSTLGVSAANAILEFGLRHQITNRFAALKDIPAKYADPAVLESIKQNALSNPHYAFDDAPKFFQETIIASYDDACHYVFAFAIFTAVASLVSTLFVEENDLETDKK